MLHNRKKLAKIVEELSIFFFSVEATEISSNIAIEDGVGIVNFEANYDPRHKEKFETMERLLSAPKNEAMEAQYWQLAGSGDPGETSQLLLIGAMVDSADIDINTSKVKIRIKKKI